MIYTVIIAKSVQKQILQLLLSVKLKIQEKFWLSSQNLVHLEL
ncbi:MAG: hypothetical protein RLZZ597_1397 [Cyanobacteriota bacterium]|jgi:hypothetical protein